VVRDGQMGRRREKRVDQNWERGKVGGVDKRGAK
jgi:hypothetical protein